MARYITTWLDYTLPAGEDFSIAVCGYSGKIRHMIIGEDTLRKQMIIFTDTTLKTCSSAEHCLVLSCPLNQSKPEHLAHMLDMWTDEPLDEELVGIWNTSSSVDALVKFADKMNEAVPEEFRKKQKPVRKSG